MRSVNYRCAWCLALGVGLTSLIEGVSYADETPQAQADEATMSEARKHFQAGVNLLDDPDGARYEEAYHAFQKAYQLSKSPKVLGNIGFCSLKLERDGEAIDAYTIYLRDSKDVDERERAQIERDLATLSSTVATFKATVKKPAGSFVLIDTREQTRGSPVVNTYPFQGTGITVRLRPGRHNLKIKSDADESLAFELAAEPASTKSHEFTFAPPVVQQPREAPRTNPSYVGPIVLGALGIAALGTGTVTGLMARGKTDDIESRCPNDVCPTTYDFRSDRTDARTFGTIADVTLIGGGVALGGAALWAILLSRGSSPSRSPRTGSTAWLPAASCGPRGCGVQIGRDF